MRGHLEAGIRASGPTQPRDAKMKGDSVSSVGLRGGIDVRKSGGRKV